jgi:hypothetical protein
MANVELSVEANLSGLRRQLESIPGLTAEQAKAMAAELNKSFKASEKAAKQAGDAAKKAMDSAREGADKASLAVGDMGDKFGKVGQSSGKLAGALSMVNPELGDMARNVADLADVGEVGASVGAFGAAAAAATAVVALFALSMAPIGALLYEQAQRAEEAAAALDRYRVAQEEAGKSAEGLAGLISDVGDEIRLKTGMETADEQAIRKKTDAMNAAVQTLRETYNAETEVAKAFIATNKAEFDSLDLKVRYTEVTEKQIERHRELKVEMDAATSAVKNNTQAVAAAQATVDTQADALKAIAAEEKRVRAQEEARRKAREAATIAAQKAAEAERKNAEAVRLAEQAVTDAEKAYAEFVNAQEKATLAADALAMKLAGEHDAALEGYAARIRGMFPQQALDKATELELMIADLSLAMTRAPTEEMGQRYVVMKDQAIAALERLRQEQEKTFDIKAAAAFFDQVNGYASGLFGNLSEVSAFYQDQANAKLKDAIKDQKSLGQDATVEERKQAEQRVKDAREAARKQFELTKALQMAQIAVNTAAAATQALASSPPPFNFIAAAAATAAGAVQMATVMATQPKFHKGGLIGQPDEQQAIVRNGEAVLNPMGRKAIGDQAIQAANAGALNNGGGAVQIVYKHKAFDYFVRDHLKTNAALPRALQAGRRLGHKGG